MSGEPVHKPRPFKVSRVVIASVAGAIGGGVGGVLGFRGGMSLDKQLGSPLGSSGGFLNIGHLTSLLLVLGLPVGVWLLGLIGHRLLGGRGGSGWGLAGTIVGLFGFVIVSMWATAIFPPVLILPPIATAVGLEFSARERSSSSEHFEEG